MSKRILTLVVICAAIIANAQHAGGREAFMRQQAYAEMQRVSSQIDALQSNFDELQRRVAQLERGRDTRELQAEIEGLKATIAELRRELSSQRGEIVKDLSKRIANMQPKDPPPPPPSRQTVLSGPTSTYTVASGDSLYLIAKAFNTSVGKLREMNNLKHDNLRIGQKLIVPQN